MPDDLPGPAAISVLKLLKWRHNVLISGVPGSGKSLLLGEVARWFVGSAQPGYRPRDEVFLPDAALPKVQEWLPSPTRKKRKVFYTAFHQGTRYRDFVRGVIPDLREGESGFRVTSGVLYEAAEFARQADSAALVVIDEINRGPAVQIFGDALVGLESDKRLGPDGQRTPTTQWFRILGDDGDYMDFELPFDLYLVAAMNQADTSVEPMDVAFLRRWEHFLLGPSEAVLQEYFGTADPTLAPAEIPAAAEDVYAALIRAWSGVNARLRRGRGAEFMMGHGLIMERLTPPTAVDQALEYASFVWRRVMTHIEEVFFGDLRGAAAALGIQDGGAHPLGIQEAYFGDTPVLELVGDPRPDGQAIYVLLLAVCGQDGD